MARISKSFITRQGQITSKYFSFQRACAPRYYQVLVAGIIKRRKFIPAQHSKCYTFPDAESADKFYQQTPLHEPSKNLKDYGPEEEEAWKHFDNLALILGGTPMY